MIDFKSGVIAASLTANMMANDLRADPPPQPLQPIHFQTIKVDGFWITQFKRLTEKWIPHCIQQMEEGGQGQELLNLVHTAKSLRGENHGKFSGLPWSDAYVYNNILGAIELSGENFFYQNPLASRASRYSWHECPCCVGNIPRALPGIKDLIYARNSDNDVLYVNHFVASDGVIKDVAGTSLRIQQETEYPWCGVVNTTLAPQQPTEFTLNLRIPDRTESDLFSAQPDPADQYTLRVNDEIVDHPIASQTLDRNDPNKFFDVEYPIPGNVIGESHQVTVRLQAEEGAMAGGIFDLRIVRPGEGK